MKGAHPGRCHERRHKRKQKGSDHYSYDHSWHTDSEKVPESRRETEPAVLKTHSVNETEPQVGRKVNIILIICVGTHADQSE